MTEQDTSGGVGYNGQAVMDIVRAVETADYSANGWVVEDMAVMLDTLANHIRASAVAPEMNAYIPPLVHLPGTKLTPEVVLHRTLNKADRIKAVAIVIQWDDDTYDTDWSQMKTSELCTSGMMLHQTAIDVMQGKVDLK